MATIKNPIEWGMEQLNRAGHHAEDVGHSLHGDAEIAETHLPQVARIGIEDLKDALRLGWQDLQAHRTDVLFLAMIYPVAGLILAHFAFNYDLLPLLFPLASGFAILGPVAAIGLYEISRRRERGEEAGWADAFATLSSPAFGAILALGLVLFVLFVAWIGTAQMIYMATLGPEPPASIGAFIRDVIYTPEGLTMMMVGTGVGFLYALIALTISIVSFPMMLDRNVGVIGAVLTSVRAAHQNPTAAAQWGMIVAALLVLGSIPLFLGYILVMPLLGHATWHLYRKIVR